jgi:hypothetical protein
MNVKYYSNHNNMLKFNWVEDLNCFEGLNNFNALKKNLPRKYSSTETA